MLIKKIIKRNVKDLSFIQNILEEKLQGKSVVTVNTSEKMYNNIFKRYGRKLEFYRNISSIEEGLFYNDGEYCFSCTTVKEGRYGTYYPIRIVNIYAAKENKIKEYSRKVQDEEKYLELFKLDAELENYLEYNFTGELIRSDRKELEEIREKILKTLN